MKKSDGVLSGCPWGSLFLSTSARQLTALMLGPRDSAAHWRRSYTPPKTLIRVLRHDPHLGDERNSAGIPHPKRFFIHHVPRRSRLLTNIIARRVTNWFLWRFKPTRAAVFGLKALNIKYWFRKFIGKRKINIFVSCQSHSFWNSSKNDIKNSNIFLDTQNCLKH